MAINNLERFTCSYWCMLYKLLILKGTIDICEMMISQFKLIEQFSKSKERGSQITNNIETLKALHL